MEQHGPSASCALVVEGHSENVRFDNISTALAQPDTQLRLFGKPKVAGKRRMAVALARGSDVEVARAAARKVTEEIGLSVRLAGPESANPE
ncbi:MAG: hypothetical protein ACKVG9_13230, partial [Rhodospirillales bacterium]